MNALPEPIALTDELLAQLDRCWLAGFAHLTPEHRQTLTLLRQIFSGTALEASLHAALDAVQQSVYQPEHFRVLAVARAALQGAQYDHIRGTIHTWLKRAPVPEPTPANQGIFPAEPLTNAAAHWLMDLAIQGFSRVDGRALSAFDSTLTQLQAIPERMALVALLNGLVDELSGAASAAQSGQVPLFRWLDLWSRALLLTAAQPQPAAQPVSGKLHLMGVAWRNQRRIISAVFYGILETDSGAKWVRTTFSAYKVNAIPPEELWLLLPQSFALLHALRTGSTLNIHGMPLLTGGDLLWNETQAQAGGTYQLMEVARKYLAAGANAVLEIPAAPAEKRHPVQIAEPILLQKFQLEESFITADGVRLPLDMPRIAGTEIDVPGLSRCDQVVGLVRYDDGQLWLQPLAAVNKKRPPIFIGSSVKSAEPPKNSILALLQERASRLLREK